MRPGFGRFALSAHGAVLAAFTAFSLFFSPPFALFPEGAAPAGGAGLNPLLQDPALAFHPPLLYLGYVGLSLSWALSAGAMAAGARGADFARLARPWALGAWSALTAGLALGSWWAYYELGWGGWWFWDPVENLALMPWLVATAQLHALAAAARGRFVAGALLLSLTGFLFALLATFAVRSGLLISVHSFALAPARGAAALAILALAGAVSLALFALKGAAVADPEGWHGVAEEKSAGRGGAAARRSDGQLALLLLNLLLLPALAAVVLAGTLYPLAASLFAGLRVGVGEDYYGLAFVPLALPLLVAAGLVSGWPRGAGLRAGMAARLKAGAWGLAAAAAGLAAVFLFAPQTPWLARAALALALWLAAETLRHAPAAWARRRGRARLAYAAMAAAHLSFALFVFAAAGGAAWSWDRDVLLAPGERLALARPAGSLLFEGVAGRAGPNWIAEEGRFAWQSARGMEAALTPQRRLYPVAGTATAETAVHRGWLADLHVVLGEAPQEGGGSGGAGGGEAAGESAGSAEAPRRVSVLYRPLVGWIWASAALAVLSSIAAAAAATAATGRRAGPGRPQAK